MGLSAFDVLIVPVLWATFGAYVAGAAIFVVKQLVEALVGQLGRASQAFKAVRGADRNRPARARRSAVHGVGSIG
jgi:hypothetical protein